MKKTLKFVGKALLAVAVLIVLALVALFAYNRVMLDREKPLIEAPIGQLVEVDGHNMCVYTAGEGSHTLVFLSGSGTACPTLDFKDLYSLLENDYRIVVIEKFGYGFSDVVDVERPFETILEEDREALAKAGITGPYVLCPHSLSGLESILWAQDHPSEVEAIVGLDMALPRAYDNFDFEGTERLENVAAFARELGLARLAYADDSLPSALTQEEKATYRALACAKAVNVDIINEGRAVPAAVALIDSKPAPDVPMLMFVSDGKEIGIENWTGIQYAYASGLSNARVVELNCDHYVHHYKAEEITEKTKDFIEGLNA